VTAETILLRRLWTYLLLLLAFAVLVGSALAVHFYSSLPNIGFSFGLGDIVGYVQPGGPADLAGVEIGDRVLAIGGVSPFAGELYVQPGQTSLPLTIRRAGQILDLEITPISPSGRDSTASLSFLLTALAFWAIAVMLLIYKPHGPRAQLLALQLLVAALAIPVLLLADSGLGWASLLTNTIVLILGVLIVYYHTVFPEPVEFRGKRVLLAVLACAGALLLVAFGWVRIGHHSEWSTPVVVAVRAFFVLCLFLGMALLAWSYWHTASKAGRRQIRVVMLGTVLALLPLVIFILLPQIVPGLPYVVIEPAFLALVFIPAGYLYAIRRHDLMRLDHAVSQTAIHSLLFLALFLLYLAISKVTGMLASLLPVDWLTADGLTLLQYGAVIAGLMASLQPLKVRIERVVHRLLYGSWYDYQSFISRMAEGLGEATEMDEILDLLLKELAGTMRLKAVALLVADRHQGKALRLQVQRGFALPAGHRLSRDLASLLLITTKPIEQQALEKRAQRRSSLQAELATWSGAGAQVWVPLVLQGEIEGVLVLGAKQADEFLTQTDQEILKTLRRHVASALARAGLVEELAGRLRENQALSRQLIKTQEQERRRIADEIHDHAVQEIIGIRMNLEMAAKDGNLGAIAPAREDLKDVIDNLRSVIGQIRPRALRSTNLVEMVRKQTAVFRDKRKLPVAVHICGNGSAVPEEVRLAVFWVFLEGVTNAWKHAGASRIEASLDIQPNRVRLEIRDDGQGFDMPPYLDELLMDGHLGLMEMRERIAQVGGEFDMTAEAGQGSRIVAEVPLCPGQRTEEK
jgi:signal transduction histidine kinase